MFFVGQSGYIITLLLTAFFPVFLLLSKPGSGFQHHQLAESRQAINTQICGDISIIPVIRVLSDEAGLTPDSQNVPNPPPSRKLKKKFFFNLCLVVAPPLLNKTNKSPPAV